MDSFSITNSPIYIDDVSATFSITENPELTLPTQYFDLTL
jgi:hypothetical protein